LTGPTGAAGSSATISMTAIAVSLDANVGTITSGVLNLTPADGTNGGIVTNGTQTFAGLKILSSDAFVNGVTIGAGGGSSGIMHIIPLLDLTLWLIMPHGEILQLDIRGKCSKQ
jgi:hypothetical protein